MHVCGEIILSLWWHSECCPWTSTIMATWERNWDGISKPHGRFPESEFLRVMPRDLPLSHVLCDSSAGQSMQFGVLKDTV